MQNLPITVKAVLLGSAKLLRDCGWTTCHMVAPDGRMCMVGAIRTFVEKSGVTDPVIADNLVNDASDQVTRTIWTDPTGAAHPHVTAWNDRACQSAEHAASMLERAASEVP